MTFARTLMASVVAGLMATSAMAMTPAEHKVAKDRIAADNKMNKQKCDGLKNNAKDICMKEAKGAESVAKAELESQFKPSDRNARKLAEARADADYAVAKEKCDDLSGNAKDVCVKDAKAAHVAAQQNAKVAAAQATKSPEKAAEVRQEATAEKNEANYKAAKERCDALAGDAKARCEDDAKRLYGQN